MVALDRLGIAVEDYAAYETNKYALTVSGQNYPLIRQFGDVFSGDFTAFKGYDLLLGGSPCTHWSIAKNDRETKPEGIGWELFLQYKRALVESGCRYFLFENNYSIHKDIKAAINQELGVEPIMINSALVSAQQRKRCYWTNIPNVVQPKDKGILLKDILESGYGATVSHYGKTLHKADIEKSQCLLARDYKGFGNQQMTGVIEPLYIPEATKQGFARIEVGDCVDLGQLNSLIRRGRSMKGKCNCLTTSNQYYQHHGKCNAPIRLGHLGKGGQGQRIYSVRGKSVTLTANGGGQGAKTGLYRINLPDGDYIIRSLTPVEAERLQTLPDGYTEGISKTQRYRCLGNGWTVDVIAHILSFISN